MAMLVLSGLDFKQQLKMQAVFLKYYEIHNKIE